MRAYADANGSETEDEQEHSARVAGAASKAPSPASGRAAARPAAAAAAASAISPPPSRRRGRTASPAARTRPTPTGPGSGAGGTDRAHADREALGGGQGAAKRQRLGVDASAGTSAASSSSSSSSSSAAAASAGPDAAASPAPAAASASGAQHTTPNSPAATAATAAVWAAAERTAARAVQLQPGQSLRAAFDDLRAELDAKGAILIRRAAGSGPPPSHAVLQRLVQAFRDDQSDKPLPNDRNDAYDACRLFLHEDVRLRARNRTAAAFWAGGRAVQDRIGSREPAAVLQRIAEQLERPASGGADGPWPPGRAMEGITVQALARIEQRSRRVTGETVVLDGDESLYRADMASSPATSVSTLHGPKPKTAGGHELHFYRPVPYVTAGPCVSGVFTNEIGLDSVLEFVEGAPKVVFVVPKRYWAAFRHAMVKRFPAHQDPGEDEAYALSGESLAFVPTAEEIKEFDIAVAVVDAVHPICFVGRWTRQWSVTLGQCVTMESYVYCTSPERTLIRAQLFLVVYQHLYWRQLAAGLWSWHEFYDELMRLYQCYMGALTLYPKWFANKRCHLLPLPVEAPSDTSEWSTAPFPESVKVVTASAELGKFLRVVQELPLPSRAASGRADAARATAKATAGRSAAQGDANGPAAPPAAAAATAAATPSPS